VLVTMRVIAGLLAGGIYPVGVAMIGDLVPEVRARQVAIGQLLAVALTGNLIGATAAGVIGDLLGWRGVFFSIGAFGLVTAVIATFAFRGLRTTKPRPFNLPAVAAGFRSVFADPRAKICFGSVFFEGIVIHGLFPYVALLLLMAGFTRSSFAGIVIAGFGAGGILYSLAVPYVILRINERQLMLIGAALAGVAFILIAMNFIWYVLAAVFVLFGIGFYMLHTCIQLHATELSHTARGTALSMHSCAFFSGQAIGPIYYGFVFGQIGTSKPMFIGAAVIVAVGLVCARFLRHPRVGVHLAEGP
jgi:predicted MFS family arabinose efflux permease